MGLENKIPNLKFETLDDLDDNSISKFNGICLVQHHTKTKFRLSEISKIP